MNLFRTLLFAPGNHPRKVEKSLLLGADVVIFDLEDAVAASEKNTTRAVVVEALTRPRNSKAYVRVNATDTEFCFGDIQAVVSDGLDGIVLPKVDVPSQLWAIDWLITQLERARGFPEGQIDLIPIIETGKGLANVEQIAHTSRRARRLSFGAGDFSLDMGMNWTIEESELDYARAKIATASRAARLEAPLDTVFIHLGVIEDLRLSAQRARNHGFQGKLCIHPEQIGPVNEVFSPTAEEVALAQKYVDEFDDAEAQGSASLQVDGYFIDYPIVEKARRTLAVARAIEEVGS